MMVDFIDYNSFLRHRSLDLTSLRDSILENVIRKSGRVIVRRSSYPLESNEFRDLIASLHATGLVTKERRSENLDRFVEVAQRDDVVKDDDSFFQFPYRSGRELKCHTDASFNEFPFDIVALFCIQNDSGFGGRSILVTLDDLLSRLDQNTIDLLLKVPVRFQFGKATILVSERWGMSIRYNRREIDAYSSKEDLRIIRVGLDKLDEALAFENATEAFDLNPGECLLIDNRRVLHGRTRLLPGNRRLLVRGRCFVQKRRRLVNSC